MHKRTAHRWRLAAILAIGVGFALGSFWLLQVMQGEEADLQALARRNEPDYIVEKFSVVRMSPAGAPHMIFSGAKLTHRPVDDVSEIESPLLQDISPGLPVTTIRARQGRIEHRDNRVVLAGGVALVRPAAPNVTPLRLNTETLTILPDEDVMETNAAVDMLLGDVVVRGTGMRANNATRQLHLEHRGQLILPPKAAPAKPARAAQPG